ncbi:solute carrier family 25 member 44 [Octopus sinensis]|uniref:Solute carrier family 25 member 44 n=1 Tax=Octopus sinensis TaxID=2607531 RepID=A0A6P7T7Z8_9MOLL|nr:solute carrier family 25 member 44 [Octopus sinensis]XP_036365385.1 solute carrier family 25 member 44 [Octopus sinensis]XP_036365386.1 solute carrier family 25 member 44 [Octopus sinensis]
MATNVNNINLQVIEFEMLDKSKYFPLTMLSSFSVRGILYPFSLIKTRLQIQRGTALYKGTIDAFIKITRNESVFGLYRGFWINALQVLPTVGYISTYETTRQFLKENSDLRESKLRSFISGGGASLVGQTMSVPIDIVSQHIMLLGQRTSKKTDVDQKLMKLQTLHISEKARLSNFGSVPEIIQQIYIRDGLRGFYRGYFVSILVFAPNSALWWTFYDTYTSMFAAASPDWIPRLTLQCLAACLSGVSASTITNPLDVIRARIQVEGCSFPTTLQILWQEEGVKMAFKGLSARVIQSVVFSFFIILGYESIKRCSLLKEYQKDIRW